MNIEDVQYFAERTKNLPRQPKAIFPSEMFLFYYEANRIGADHIIESGIGYGGSTDYLDELFPQAYITSVDRGKLESVRERHPRVKFVQGQGELCVPHEATCSPGERIAILIDGPKGMQAIWLMTRLLRNERVRMVAIHDLQSDVQAPFYLERPGLRDQLVRKLRLAHINSHDPTFRELAGYLDEGINKKYPDGPGLSVYHA